MSLVGSALRAGVKAADAAAAWGGMAVDDFVHLGRTLDGNDIDAWDPDYIRRVPRQRPQGVRQGCARPGLPGRRLRDVPTQLALRPDRVRRPEGVCQARA